MATVLVVESVRSDRVKLVEALEGRGISTVEAQNLQRARKEIERNSIDAAVICVGLSDGSGVELLDEFASRPRPYVVLTCNDEDGRVELQSKGISDIPCMIKPLSWSDIRAIKSGIASRNRRALRRAPAAGTRYDLMLGDCPQMRQLYALISKVAPADSRVLISGESGTGKELVARSIHHRSARKDKPFLAINCGAIPENLIESELFGHVKGAFTGANTNRRGVFELAHGGTLFLDEIGEMPADMQVRLLRVLETGKVMRVGDEREISMNVRVLAATNRDPAAAIADGRLREDLVYRLAVFPIHLPPLRERGNDVILLAHQFLEQFNESRGGRRGLTEAAERRLLAYDWPGNVRQLQNIIERAVILEGERIELETLDELIENQTTVAANNHHAVTPVNGSAAAPSSSAAAATIEQAQAAERIVAPDSQSAEIDVHVGDSLEQAERKLILATLDECEGDKKRAAEILGISLKTLYNRLNEYEVAQQQPAQ